MSRRFLCGALLGAALLSTAAAIAADKPLYGTFGFDVADMDKTAKPGDGFFRYANGTWLDTHTIPADKPQVTLRLEMTDRTEARLHDMLEQAAAKAAHQPTDLEGKVGAFYKAFMDESAHREAGRGADRCRTCTPCNRAKTRDDLAALMGRANADFEASLFNFNIDVDLKDPKRYAVYLGQADSACPTVTIISNPRSRTPKPNISPTPRRS